MAIRQKKKSGAKRCGTKCSHGGLYAFVCRMGVISGFGWKQLNALAIGKTHTDVKANMAEKGVQVVVTFPKEISPDVQGPVLLLMELALRTLTKLDVRVTKDLMGDDSKLRRLMTIKQRESL